MDLIDIATLSQSSGVPPSTLRYYEELGLIHSCARHGLRRQYDEQTLTQLALISLGKAAGFSLEQIKGMFGQDGSPNLSRPVLHERADAIEDQVRRLNALRDTLRHVADCPAPSHMQCPKFQQLLRVIHPQAVCALPKRPKRQRPGQ